MLSVTEGGVRVVAVLLLSLMVFTPLCDGVEYCYVKAPSWTADSHVHLSLFTSLRKANVDDNHCGEILSESLQMYVAVAWVIDKLNQGDGFIPGIKFDFQVYDDCQNPVYAARNALSVLSPSLSTEVTECNDTDTSLHLGIIGPSRSETAIEAARLLKSSNVPLISPSATVADLSNKSNYPNFFRTALPDTLQIRPVIDVLLELDWTYVVVVHSDDIYGRTAADMLRTKGRESGVCFIKSIEVTKPFSGSGQRTTLFDDLAAVQESTKGGTLGVVYFGIWTIAEDLMDYYSRNTDITKLYWLMSDSVGKMHGVFSNKGSAVTGTLTLSPSTVEFEELKTFWFNKLSSNQIVRQYRLQHGHNDNLMNSSQSDYIAASVDAAYAYAVALKKAHNELCKGQRGLCESLKNRIKSKEFLPYVEGVMVNYTSLNASYVPKEFIDEGRYFEFKDTGDVYRGSDSVMYQVNSVTDQAKFVTVGQYTSSGLTLNKTSIQMRDGNSVLTGETLPKSLCKGYCKACVEFGHVPMVYLDGDVYIVGVFSLHVPDSTSPFQCGDFRSVSSDTVALEAFIYSVMELRKMTGINFGAVAFDDCYSSERLTSIISEYFSSIGKPAEVFSNLVLLNKTAAVVGSLSSGSTIPLARFFNGLNVPVISYAASSPDLDDRVNFPNFLRTVPSDVEQARAMVAIIKAMDWEYVSLLFVSNNYGTKGMQTFRQLATQAGICVAAPKNISETSGGSSDSSLYTIVDELVRDNAKVVVFFGIDTRFEDFVQVVHEKREYGRFVIIASEDWGNKPNILTAGKRATRGAITLKIEPLRTRPFPGFEGYLLAKTPDNYKTNPWFGEFWQSEFKCNIRGGFNNIEDTECSAQDKLSKQMMQIHFDNQRVSHVQYAVYAAGMGVANVKRTLCRDFVNDFPCRFYYDPDYTQLVWESIRQVQNPQLQSFMFDDNGNGAIGFTVYNVQDNDNTLTYEVVGSFGGRGLELDKEKVKFYDKLGYPTDIVAKCGTGSQCSMCDLVTAAPAAVTQIPSGTDNGFRIPDIIIIVIIVLFIVILVVAIILCYRYFKTKVTGLSKEIQRYGNRDPDHIYQAVSDRMVYQNRDASPERRAVPPPNQHIYFVNGSNDNLHETGGQVNHGFRADDTLSQRNISGGTIASTGVTNTSTNSGQTQAVASDNSSQSPRNNSVSPTSSGQLVMTEIPLSLSPNSERTPNGQIPNGVVGSPDAVRPTTLQFHQNPRFIDLRQMSVDNGPGSNVVSPNHVLVRPDLQHMPESYLGSPAASMSPMSDSRQFVPSHTDAHTSPSHVVLNHPTQPIVVADPSILQTLANQQAALDQQAAYTALELQRLQLLQQQSALNQHPSNPYIPLSSAQSLPRPPQYPLTQQISPEEIPIQRLRPRTNPQHMTPNLNRVLAHHGSVDSLRSSGRSHGQVQNLTTQDSVESIPENIPMQSLDKESRISRV